MYGARDCLASLGESGAEVLAMQQALSPLNQVLPSRGGGRLLLRRAGPRDWVVWWVGVEGEEEGRRKVDMGVTVDDMLSR